MDELKVQYAAIEDAMSKIAMWANSPHQIATLPRAIFVNAWMNRMMGDKTTALSCYLEVYAPRGPN